MPQRPKLTRRGFLKTTTAAAAMSMSASSYARIMGAGARLNIAYIGVGGIAGGQHIGPLAKLGAGCPAYCDVDTDRWGNCADRWPEAKGYTDYRKMFDAHEKDIDAVMIGTPDHQHYPATIQAMMRGKHVYTQKPLTHTPWESRQLSLAQEKTKLATQMGNQGHASDGLRGTIDFLRSGAIGDLLEAHVWTNRPIWRQGMAVPEGGQEIPENLDWDSWIGPAKTRSFHHDPADGWGGFYHPFNWRGFWDFGCGALGDMACHNLDPLYWAMEPGYPTEIELMDGEAFGDAPMYVQNTTVRFHFPADGERPAFDTYWHDGGNRPERPEELPEGENLPNQGALYIGTEGKLYAKGDSRNWPKLLPESKNKEYGRPEQQIERSADGHHKEWYLACTEDKPYDFPKSNFSYAAPFTEMILLGCIAQRVGGKLPYDPEKMTFEGRDDATALITKEYREGWDFRL
ncbi:MAG TPA: Gfo/Idh/MocA family oxidoreductase [Planctomycetota bacterium]|nr:Gfo/Idh/MocA family oxidoreductase [Planctomycetota bacterium]